jgi:hypothetical protein
LGLRGQKIPEEVLSEVDANLERFNKVPASIDRSPSVKPQAGSERTFMVVAVELQDLAEQAEAFINKMWVEQGAIERLKQHQPVSHETRQWLQQYIQNAARLQQALEPLRLWDLRSLQQIHAELQQVLTALRQTSAKIAEVSQRCDHPEIRERLARLHIGQAVGERVTTISRLLEAFLEEWQPLSAFIAPHAGMLEMLYDGLQHLRQIFPDSPAFTIALEADCEVADWAYVVIRVKTALPVETASARIAAFDETWLLDHSAEIGGTLLFDVEYICPSNG